MRIKRLLLHYFAWRHLETSLHSLASRCEGKFVTLSVHAERTGVILVVACANNVLAQDFRLSCSSALLCCLRDPSRAARIARFKNA